jgi:hypothetical protein
MSATYIHSKQLLEFRVTDAGNLNVGVAAGIYDTEGSYFSGSASEACTDDATNYVEFDRVSGTVSINTTAFTSDENHFALATVVTVSGDITGITDKRALIGGGESGDTADFIKKDGSITYTGDQPMGSNKHTGLAAGSANGDSVRYEQACRLADAQTVNGIKTFGSFGITPSSAPTTNYQWANKKYVDDQAGGGGLSFGGSGADGALNITSGTVNIALDAIKNYSSISITGTGSLSTSVSSGIAMLLNCSGNCTITSSATAAINCSGKFRRSSNETLILLSGTTITAYANGNGGDGGNGGGVGGSKGTGGTSGANKGYGGGGGGGGESMAEGGDMILVQQEAMVEMLIVIMELMPLVKHPVVVVRVRFQVFAG